MATKKLVQLPREITETTNFSLLVGETAPDIEIDGSQVVRVSSAGVRSWELYFSALSAQGIRVIFKECSPALVEAAGLMQGLFNRHNTLSVRGPYVCEKCGKITHRTFTVHELLNQPFSEYEIPCAHCGKKAVFDDLPSTYFAFLGR
jgi:hypothetical protein